MCFFIVLAPGVQTNLVHSSIKVCCRRRLAAWLTISNLKASATKQIISSSQIQSVRLRASIKKIAETKTPVFRKFSGKSYTSCSDDTTVLFRYTLS